MSLRSPLLASALVPGHRRSPGRLRAGTRPGGGLPHGTRTRGRSVVPADRGNPRRRGGGRARGNPMVRPRRRRHGLERWDGDGDTTGRVARSGDVPRPAELGHRPSTAASGRPDRSPRRRPGLRRGDRASRDRRLYRTGRPRRERRVPPCHLRTGHRHGRRQRAGARPPPGTYHADDLRRRRRGAGRGDGRTESGRGLRAGRFRGRQLAFDGRCRRASGHRSRWPGRGDGCSAAVERDPGRGGRPPRRRPRPLRRRGTGHVQRDRDRGSRHHPHDGRPGRASPPHRAPRNRGERDHHYPPGRRYVGLRGCGRARLRLYRDLLPRLDEGVGRDRSHAAGAHGPRSSWTPAGSTT